MRRARSPRRTSPPTQPGPRAAALVLLCLLDAGCTRQVVTLSPGELHRHVPELRRAGRATVELAPSGTMVLARDQTLQVTFDTCPTPGACDTTTRKLTVAELIAGCPDVPPFQEDRSRRDSACLLLRARAHPIPVGSRHVAERGTWKLIGGVALAAIVLGVVFGYVVSCSQPDDGC